MLADAIQCLHKFKHISGSSQYCDNFFCSICRFNTFNYIDFFKKVNDTYGHSKGDIILKEFGKILSDNCGQTDLIFRNGGEEFSLIMVDCPYTKAIETGEQIRSVVENYNFKLEDSGNVHFTVSIGISSYPDITSNVDDLLEEADKALYNAKRLGRNKVVLSGQPIFQ